jgi:flagellar hook assembly protein FlgD
VLRGWAALVIGAALLLPMAAVSAGAASVTTHVTIPALAVGGLTCSPQPFDPTSGRATISFVLSRPAAPSLVIRDWSGAAIYIAGSASTTPGPRSFLWDGRGLACGTVAPSWYTATVYASQGSLSAQAATPVAVSYGAPLRLTGVRAQPASIAFGGSTLVTVKASRAAYMGVRITTSRGDTVRTAPESLSPAGTFSYRWDGRDSSGHRVVEGRYYIVLIGRDSGGGQASATQLVTVRQHEDRFGGR